MKVLRTSDERFAGLPDFPFMPRYSEVATGTGTQLRLHYLDEGRRDGALVLLLHGEPAERITTVRGRGYRFEADPAG